jgi:ATP-dependent DNA helicase DinG
MFDLALIDKYFPHNEFRQGQRECIEAILNAFSSGKKFVILEGPTGSGKSAIGMTIARFFRDSYYLTTQKILQDQLSRDFGHVEGVKVLKGRNAYHCNYWETYMELYHDDPTKMAIMNKLANDPVIGPTMANPSLSCDQGVCKVKDRTSKCQMCVNHGTCPYLNALNEAVYSSTCLMNFHSFLYQTTVASERFKPRELLIIDEAHNTEAQLMDFISLTITDRDLEGIKFPKYDTAQEYANYFDHIDLPNVLRQKCQVAAFAQDFKGEERWKKMLLQYQYFVNSVTQGDWIVKWEDNKSFRKVMIKPIFVDAQAQRYLFNFGGKVLMMSATVFMPQVLYDSLGIDPNDAFAYRMSNRFPLKNRPIYFTPAGSMSFKNKQETMPKLSTQIEEIATKHKDHKGIIHTHNFEIAKYIIDNSSRKLKPRILFQEDFNDKDEMLKEHASRKNSIIVAPAMHEGLDLKGDLSRFQIICKIPYPSFAENDQLKIRMQISQDYYDWLTALKLVQSYGRSIRSDDDWADTYILDADFSMFRSRAGKKLLPKWFTDAIIQTP